MKERGFKKFFAMEGLTNFWFKKDQAGRTIFFPWGALGKGRVVPSKISEDRIRECVGSHWTSQFTLGIIGATVSTYTLYFLMVYVLTCASLFIWYYFQAKKLVAGLPISETELTWVESYANYTADWSSFTVWLVFLFSILCLVGLVGLLADILLRGSQIEAVVWLVFIFFFLLLGGIVYIFGHVIELRTRCRDRR